MTKTISITNERVLEILDEKKREKQNQSLFIQEAILHYHEAQEKQYIGRMEVVEIVYDLLKGSQLVANCATQIINTPQVNMPKFDDVDDDVADIMDLE